MTIIELINYAAAILEENDRGDTVLLRELRIDAEDIIESNPAVARLLDAIEMKV